MTMLMMRISRLIQAAALVAFLTPCAGAETRLLWMKTVQAAGKYGFSADMAVDAKAERILVQASGIPVLSAYDRQGRLAWKVRSDACFSTSRDANRVWLVQGKHGVILEGFSGKQIVKSRELRGLVRLPWEGSPYCSVWLPEDRGLSPDGKTFFDTKVVCAEEGYCGKIEEMKSMAVDAETGKLLWRKDKDIFPNGEMPDDASFIINGNYGIFSRSGEVLWVFPNRIYDLDERYPEKLWLPPSLRGGPDRVSKSGRYMFSLETSANEADEKVVYTSRGYRLLDQSTNYLLVNPGDPGKPWKKVQLAENPHAVTFSDDDRYFLGAFHEEGILGEPPQPWFLKLYRIDGSVAWSKTINPRSLANGMGPDICTGGAALRWRDNLYDRAAAFIGKNILVNFGVFADVYDLEGNLVKRIVVRHGTIPRPCRGVGRTFRFMPDGHYLVVDFGHPDEAKKTMELRVYEGRLDEPD